MDKDYTEKIRHFNDVIRKAIKDIKRCKLELIDDSDDLNIQEIKIDKNKSK
jgi:hypothetical protein